MTNIKVAILVGAPDFGRCPLGSRLNRAVWPVFGKPALQRTIDLLIDQGMSRFVICCQGEQADIIRNTVKLPEKASVELITDFLPRGPAGCIKDSFDFIKDDLLLVIPANIVSVPDIWSLHRIHLTANSPLSIFLNPKNEVADFPLNSGIYICNADAVRMIPESGFMDIKEGLVRELVRADKPAKAFYLEVDAGNFRTWPEYINATLNHLTRHVELGIEIDGYSFDKNKLQWIGAQTSISQKAKIFGPAVIGAGTVIEDDVSIEGPVVTGHNVHICKESVIKQSVLWDDSVVGPGSKIQHSLIDINRSVEAQSNLKNCLAVYPPNKTHQLINKHKAKKHRKHATGLAGPVKTNSSFVYSRNPLATAMIGFLILMAALIYSYWPTLRGIWKIWVRNDEYSSGMLVPMVAAYIIWNRREILKRTGLANPSIWGFAALALAQAFRLFGLYYKYASVERLSFVISLCALVLIILGKRIFMRFLPVLLFLFLMLPLPKQVELQITAPLQQWATASAVFCLETAGFNVWQEGNIIHINDTLVAVAEACNGLRMLTAFVTVSGMAVLMINRKWWEKTLILFSSVTIALICNTARLAVTAVFFTFLDTAKWERIFHDFGGFAMMPVAILIILFELWIFSALVIESEITT